MRKRSQKGFTLVEVIVVAVIVAVLAAVAIPLYLNYITDSRSNAANNASGTIASFCGACINSGGTIAAGAYTSAAALVCTGNAATMQIPANITATITATTVSAIHDQGGVATLSTYR
jgi:type IV pilus assembly protein PilA